MAAISEKRIHQLFEISVLLKGLHAVIECVGGLAIALVSTETIVRIANWLTADELLEDPQDLVANYLRHAAQSFSMSGKTFAAVYLLSHGVVKLFVVAALLQQRPWAYPLAIAVFSLFIAYQLYRFSFTHSPELIVLTIFDLFVIYLTWHEYRLVRRHMPLE